MLESGGLPLSINDWGCGRLLLSIGLRLHLLSLPGVAEAPGSTSRTSGGRWSGSGRALARNILAFQPLLPGIQPAGGGRPSGGWLPWFEQLIP